MSQNSCCSFCVQLPTIARPSRGNPSKCPLCKQELWTSPDGVTHRLVDIDGPAPGKKPRLLLAGLGVGLLGIALALVGGMRLAQRPRETVVPPPLEIAAAASAPAPVCVQAEAAVPAPYAVARVKGAIPDSAIRVKPAPALRITPLAKSAAKTPGMIADHPPRAKGIEEPVPAGWRWAYVHSQSQAIAAMLAGVPEVDLDADYAKKAKDEIASRAEEIAKLNADEPDAFIKKLVKERTDLAGLPFLMGKDCKLKPEEAKSLANGSLAIRGALSVPPQPPSRRPRSPSDSDEASAAAPVVLLGKARYADPAALQQIISAEKPALRRELVWTMRNVTDPKSLANQYAKTASDPKATQVLVKFALYDVDDDVRAEALKALSNLPAKAYFSEVMKAFRHPWPPIAQNAAQAVIKLDMKDALPELVGLLNEPDPAAPFSVNTDGVEKKMIREMVRINHHRNCMLCHPPLGDAEVKQFPRGRLPDFPVGPVPSMQEPLPPAISAAYYSIRPGSGILVRADVTYLRQDFSVQMAVKDAGKWPGMQRFDFFVRTRAATAKDIQDHAAAPDVTPHQAAILEALEGLTGKVKPPRADAWQAEVDSWKMRYGKSQAKGSP